jgi:hypothetical protein
MKNFHKIKRIFSLKGMISNYFFKTALMDSNPNFFSDSDPARTHVFCWIRIRIYNTACNIDGIKCMMNKKEKICLKKIDPRAIGRPSQGARGFEIEAWKKPECAGKQGV